MSVKVIVKPQAVNLELNEPIKVDEIPYDDAETGPEEINTISDLIVYIARVSNPKSQQQGKNPEKLINYLTREKHWSPFEMVNYTLEINTTRDIARQILRHRSFSFQEFSQRYADVRLLSDAMVKRQARLQDLKNRQSSIKTNDIDLSEAFVEDQQEVWDLALENYDKALKSGIAKEQARALLPEGLTPSRIYMNGTLRSWIHYIALRTGNGTQLEHQDIARMCADGIAEEGVPEILNFVAK